MNHYRIKRESFKNGYYWAYPPNSKDMVALELVSRAGVVSWRGEGDVKSGTYVSHTFVVVETGEFVRDWVWLGDETPT